MTQLLRVFSFFLILLSCFVANAQFDGFVLYGHMNSSTARLIDENGSIAKQWSMSGDNGYAMALTDDGNLVRAASNSGNQLTGAAVAGKLQEIDPTGAVVWQFVYSSSSYVSHHDICLMPNGNVLLIAWYNPGNSVLQAAGYSGSSNKYPTRIIEVEQNGTGGQIVWEWNMLDHFIQDVDVNKPNYGVIADYPERMNINVSAGGFGGDWFHVNGIDYNPTLDQIAFTSRYLSELFIIDHSTTTAEAATSAGGNAGMGGDFLYRWGNPSNYDMPGSQTIDAAVHDVRWIKSGAPNAGYLQFVNNEGGSGNSTTIDAINPPLSGYNYTRTVGQAFGPTSHDWRHNALASASGQSASDRLPNGNTFVAISMGYMYEVDSMGNVVWQYNDDPQKAFRYSCTHPGIIALLGANPCGTVGIDEFDTGSIKLGPNPASDMISIYGVHPSDIASIQISDALGRSIRTVSRDRSIDISNLANGIFLVELRLVSGQRVAERIIVQH